MERRYFLIASLVLAAAAAEGAGYKTGNNDAEAFSRLKTLVGDWQADTQMGKIHLNYELIAGGTVLVERETGEKMPPMLTVYYMDGRRLLLTHYCMAGNQPRMQAKAFNQESGEVDFQFLDATNLANPNAGHMHNARIRIAGGNELVSAWDFYENGQLKRTETARYTRVR
jgi:hypothetical protein